MAKFLLDEHLSPRIAALTHKSGVETLAIAASPWAGMKDPEVLKLATSEGRILGTYNIQHFALLLADAIAGGHPPPGIVYVDDKTFSPRDYSGLALALKALSDKIDRGEVDPSAGVFLTR